MLDIWDVSLLLLEIFYIFLHPYFLGLEGDIDAIHDILLHRTPQGLLPTLFSALIFPVYATIGIKASLFFSKFLILSVFFLSTRLLRKTISKLYGEETSITYYLITALQGQVGMNSSRLSLDNYSFIAGTLLLVLLLSPKSRYFILGCAIWLFWNLTLLFDLGLITNSSVSDGSTWSNIQFIALISGCISQKPLSELIDLRVSKLLITAAIATAVCWFLPSQFVVLPIYGLLSARGMAKL